MKLNRREALAHISKHVLWTAPATTLLVYTPKVLAQSQPPTIIDAFVGNAHHFRKTCGIIF